MYTTILVAHIIICVLLVGIVLIQSGRGGGLVESFSGAESIFGTKTNSFLTRSTGVLASLFIVTCLSLTFISAGKSRSLIKRQPAKPQVLTVTPEETDAASDAVEDAGS
ncbi:MAG: preprotein translocase subunit SecG [Candidatus Omnitrophota bacterium]